MTKKLKFKKCVLCGKRVFSNNSDHCARCIHSAAARRIEAHVRRHGFVCQYTRKKLNLTDPQSPFYFVFDHQIPGDERTVVLTFALLNEMKSDMSFKEFKYYLRQLFNNLFLGKPIIARRLIYWARLINSRLRRP